MEERATGHLRVETTVEEHGEALRLADSVVAARLAACVQVAGPVTSVYRWAGAVQNDKEWLLVMKTSADRLEALTGHIRREHPYEVPEVVAVPVAGGNQEYLDWVTGETRPET